MSEFKTFVVSKDIPLTDALKIVKEKFGKQYYMRYTKWWSYDTEKTLLLHDVNWYFCIETKV